MHPQPLICATDVEASSRWYQQLLGVRSDHGGPHYERLMDGDRLVMQLHNFDVEHDHGRIGQPDDRPYGNGVLLWFEVDDFDAAVSRGAQMGVNVVLAPHRNPPAGGEPEAPPRREWGLHAPDVSPAVGARRDGEARLEGGGRPPTNGGGRDTGTAGTEAAHDRAKGERNAN